MKSLFVSAFVGFGVTLGAFALFADNSFWSQDASTASAAPHEDSATLALTAEPSIQEQPTEHGEHAAKSGHHRKPQAEEMSIALRPKDSKVVAAKKLDLGHSEVTTTSMRSVVEPKLGGKWSVQIASFKTEAEANTKLASMKKDGFDGFIENAEVNGNQVYRVKIGPVANKSEAQAMHAKLIQMPGLAGSILSKSKQ